MHSSRLHTRPEPPKKTTQTDAHYTRAGHKVATAGANPDYQTTCSQIQETERADDPKALTAHTAVGSTAEAAPKDTQPAVVCSKIGLQRLCLQRRELDAQKHQGRRCSPSFETVALKWSHAKQEATCMHCPAPQEQNVRLCDPCRSVWSICLGSACLNESKSCCEAAAAPVMFTNPDG